MRRRVKRGDVVADDLLAAEGELRHESRKDVMRGQNRAEGLRSATQPCQSRQSHIGQRNHSLTSSRFGRADCKSPGKRSDTPLSKRLKNVPAHTPWNFPEAHSPQTFEKMLRNPIYSGWIVIAGWGVRERGSFAPLVSEELFRRVQDIFDGKRLSVTSHQRNNPDFPPRVFVSCGACGTPLTGSWSKGRKGRYPYYRCRNSHCRAVNVRRESLERDFAALLERLAPERRYMRLFKEIVRQVWKQRVAASESVLRAAKGKLAELENRKNRLVDFLLEGRLDQQTYDEETMRLRGEIESAERELREADLEQMDLEAVLAFAEKLVERPRQLGLESTLKQKQRLQRVFFLDGVKFTKEGFGTAVNNSFFGVLRNVSEQKATLASPTGFEPVLPP